MTQHLTLLQLYGVLAYCVLLSFFLAMGSIGIAYWRAGRSKFASFLLATKSFLLALFFGYLALISINPPWLVGSVTQPYVRTAALVAGFLGWGYIYLLLHREAKNGTLREQNFPGASTEES